MKGKNIWCWTLGLGVIVAVIFLPRACVSPDTRAKQLYRTGKYEAVLERYPDSQWADSVKAMSVPVDSLESLRIRVLLNVHEVESRIEELEDIRWEFLGLLDSIDTNIAAVRKNQKVKP